MGREYWLYCKDCQQGIYITKGRLGGEDANTADEVPTFFIDHYLHNTLIVDEEYVGEIRRDQECDR